MSRFSYSPSTRPLGAMGARAFHRAKSVNFKVWEFYESSLLQSQWLSRIRELSGSLKNYCQKCNWCSWCCERCLFRWILGKEPVLRGACKEWRPRTKYHSVGHSFWQAFRGPYNRAGLLKDVRCRSSCYGVLFAWALLAYLHPNRRRVQNQQV